MYIFPMQEGTLDIMDLLPILDGTGDSFPLLDGSGDSCQQQPTEPVWLATCSTRESVQIMAPINSRIYNSISILFCY
jgi:hypothetical protein